MIYLLYGIFFISCILIFIRILKEFHDGYDLFSVALYLLIFIISCALVWLFIFSIYYLSIGEML
jgi:hypothetical protein